MTDDNNNTDGDTEHVTLDLNAAVQIADILEMHYELTKEDAYQHTADDAAHFSEAIYDQLPEFHQEFGSDYYCRLHGASFEPQEMHGGGLCPWCARPVETGTGQEH